MHVALATRTELPLPLAQWRAGGQLVELRASDLRFSVEETERLFDQVAGSILSIAGIWGTAASDCTPADWALQWLWSQPEVSVVLSGMSTMQQVEENVASAGVSGVRTLTAEEAALFDQVRARYGCTTSPMLLGGNMAGGTMPSPNMASSTTTRGLSCASGAASAGKSAPSASRSASGCR